MPQQHSFRARLLTTFMCAALVSGLGALGACKKKPNKKAKKGCEPAEITKLQGALDSHCVAVAKASDAPEPYWRDLALAPAPLAPEVSLPRAPLVVLTPKGASLNGKPLPGWVKLIAKQKPDPKVIPALRKELARRRAADNERQRTAAELAKKQNAKRRAQGKATGMLGVLSEMTPKLGTMFKRDKAVTADAEDALRALMGDVAADKPSLDPDGVKVLAAFKAIRTQGKTSVKKLPDDSLIHLAVAPETKVGAVQWMIELLGLAGYARLSLVYRSGKAKGLQNLAADRPRAPSLAAAIQSFRGELRRWERAGCGRLGKRDWPSLFNDRRTCRRAAKQLPIAVSECKCSHSPVGLGAHVSALTPHLAFLAARSVSPTTGLNKPIIAPRVDQTWASLTQAVLAAPPTNFQLVAAVSALPPVKKPLAGRGFGLGSPDFGVGGGPGDGGAGKYPSRRPGVRIPRGKVSGGLDAATVRRVIRRHLSEIQYCYVSVGLTKNPSLAGKVVVVFIISGRGTTLAVKIKRSTLKSPPAERCMTSAIRRWRFPKPEGGLVKVVYPFIFKPTGG